MHKALTAWKLTDPQRVQDMSSKTASGAREPVIQLITRFCSSSIFLVGRTPPRPTAMEEVEVPVEAVAGVEAEAPKRTPTPLTTPQNHQAPNLMQNDQLCPVGGATGIIRPPMAPGHVISVCAADCSQGLQDRVHGQSSKNNGGPVHSDPSKPGKMPGSRTRPRVNAGKTSDQGNPPLNGRSRVLFPDLPGGQGVGRLAPDPQPESVQQICKAPTLFGWRHYVR